MLQLAISQKIILSKTPGQGGSDVRHMLLRIKTLKTKSP